MNNEQGAIWQDAHHPSFVAQSTGKLRLRLILRAFRRLLFGFAVRILR
jgi:hypothetical protein